MIYTNGLPFSTCLAESLDRLKTRVENNKAALLIIDGGIGEGKTTLLIHVLDYINKISGLDQIELKLGRKNPQIAMGGLEFVKKIRLCYEGKLPCIGYDEAGDFTKRGSLTRFNAMMNRVFETFRAFKCIVVMTLPQFNVLDQDIFDKNIPRLLIHLKGRTSKTGNFYGYSLYRMLLLRGRMKKLNIKNYAFATVQSNFYGHFLDLDKERSKELDLLSTQSKLSILRKSEVKLEGLLTYAELATKLMKSTRWVKGAVSALNIKHDRLIKRVKYFTADSLNILTEHSEYTSENPKKKSGRPKK